MKLGQQPERRPRLLSRDVLIQETKPESDFFDPRVDFPASELARLKKLAGDLEMRTSQLHVPADLKDAWWLGLVDPEFKSLLESDPQFEFGLKVEFDIYYKRCADNSKIGLEAVWPHSVPAIQLFPALRGQIRQQYGDASLPTLLQKETRPVSVYEKLTQLSTMLQLYPEKRAEWLEVYSVFPDTLVENLKNTLVDPQGVRVLPEIKVNMVATALLVFPELRSQILSLELPREDWKKVFTSGSIPLSHFDFQFAFDLTVIGADSARINQDGQIELRLKPLTTHTPSHPLPDRPLA